MGACAFCKEVIIMSKRNVTVDILRGIGIILVIIGHLRHMIPDDSPINLVIYSFHMPLFLIVSGYLFAAKSEKDRNAGTLTIKYAKKKYRSSIVPYFLFSLLSLIYTLPNSQYTAKEMLIGILAGGGADVSRVDNVALWFLPMFFLATLIFSAIYTISLYPKNPITGKLLFGALILLTSALGNYVIEKSGSKYFFWSIDIALLVQIFLYAGYLFRDFEKHLEKGGRIFTAVVMVSCAVVWIAMIRLNGRIDLNARSIGNTLFYYICGISGTFFWYLICRDIISRIPVISGVLAWCGNNSLLIMGLHLPISMILYGGLSDYLPFSEYTWSPDIFGVIYIISYNILFTAIIKYALHIGNKSE